jgi:molybdopterin converting factor small subunit
VLAVIRLIGRSMVVKVTLYGILRERLAKETRGKLTLELPEGSTVQDARAALGIETHVLCVLNGKNERDFQTSLKDGDEVSFLHPVGGGSLVGTQNKETK